MTEKYVQDVENTAEVGLTGCVIYQTIYIHSMGKCSDPDLLNSALDASEKALIWKQDLRIVPLCAAIYLLCYLDRSNIGVFLSTGLIAVLRTDEAGNAKILNEDTHDDLLSETNMTSYQYT